MFPLLGAAGGSLPSMQGGKGGDATSGVDGNSTLAGYLTGGGASGPIYNFGSGSVTSGGVSTWVWVAGLAVVGFAIFFVLRRKGSLRW